MVSMLILMLIIRVEAIVSANAFAKYSTAHYPNNEGFPKINLSHIELIQLI